MWHSCLAQLEVDAQDLETPEDASSITERLLEVQQLHSQLAKQAEQRTTLIGKVGRTAAEPVVTRLVPPSLTTHIRLSTLSTSSFLSQPMGQILADDNK